MNYRMEELDVREIEARTATGEPMKFCKDFVVIPDKENRELILFPVEDGTVLRLNKERAAMLAGVIAHQIQSW